VYFVFIYENRRMKTVEIVRRRGRGDEANKGGGESKTYLSMYVNITMYPLYNYYMLIKSKNDTSILGFRVKSMGAGE
jgi:hypothetical protein